MPLEFAAATDVGRKRDHNEDALLVMPEHSLAVVCDGMGGHEAGEVASGIGVETVKKFFELTSDPQALARKEFEDAPSSADFSNAFRERLALFPRQ